MPASPAQIIRACLVDQALVIMPGTHVQIPGDGTTICFVSSMPDEVDQAVALLDMPGLFGGRRHKDGKYLIHPGVKVQIRALDHDVGCELVESILNGIGTIVRTTISVGSEVWKISSAYRIGSLIPNEEQVGRKRQQWTQNIRVAFDDDQSPLG